MLKYLAIYRPINILFIALAQWLCAYYLDGDASSEALTYGGIYYLLSGTASCAAFGYWINDWLDISRDAINKDNPSTIGNFSQGLVIAHLISFALLAIGCGAFLGKWFVVLFTLTLFILSLYSSVLKNVAIVGNSAVAILSFLSLYAVIKLFPNVDYLLILHFATMAGFINFAREIIKDAEDTDGDISTGAKTVPVVFGFKALNSSVFIVLLFTVAFLVVSLYFQINYFRGMLQIVYYAYVAVFVLIPLFYVAIQAMFAEHKQDYTQLSLVLKYILFTGILSILFF